jgi:Arm DNA-binding domain
MLVTPTGGRLWRFKYRMNGVEKLLTLGKYPNVSLKRAREKRDDARKLAADNVDPSVKRQAERNAAADTFGAIATEWLNLHKPTWADETISILESRVKSYLLPSGAVRLRRSQRRSCWACSGAWKRAGGMRRRTASGRSPGEFCDSP